VPVEMGGSAGTWAAVPVILSSSAGLPRASLSSSVATSALSVVLVVHAHDKAKTVGRAASEYICFVANLCTSFPLSAKNGFDRRLGLAP
jgi:hypothetical protein